MGNRSSEPSYTPAFMDAPTFVEPGPPRCRWADVTVGEVPCRSEARFTRGTLVLCSHHQRLIAKWVGFVDRRDVDEKVRVHGERLAEDLIRQKNETIDHLRRWLQEERQPTPEPKNKRPVATEGVVYFLRVGGYIKIGWTSNLEKRMRGYQPDTILLATKPGTRKDERALHRKFAHLKTHGREWFPLAPQIMEEVERTVKDHGEPPAVDFSAREAQRIVGPRLNRYVGGERRGPGPNRQHNV